MAVRYDLSVSSFLNTVSHNNCLLIKKCRFVYNKAVVFVWNHWPVAFLIGMYPF